MRGSVTSLPCNKVLAWLRHAGREDSVLDGVSPPLRALASDFGKTQSHQKSSPPLVRPPASGSLGSGKRSGGTTQTVHPCTACVCAVVHDGAPDLVPSPRRTTGGNSQPAAPRPVNRRRVHALHRGNTPQLLRAKSGRVVISQPTHGETRLSHLCNRYHRHGCIDEEIIVSTTASSTYPYLGMALY